MEIEGSFAEGLYCTQKGKHHVFETVSVSEEDKHGDVEVTFECEKCGFTYKSLYDNRRY